jgi:hypothetical protein
MRMKLAERIFVQDGMSGEKLSMRMERAGEDTCFRME